MNDDGADQLERRVRSFFDMIDHGGHLGIRLRSVAPGRVSAALPYRGELVGNPETGVLHGGVITTLVDQTSGAAVLAALTAAQPIATLDLRIDYLRPAGAGAAVVAHAECYRVGREIAFARCTVEQGGDGTQVAASMSTFMRLAGAA